MSNAARLRGPLAGGGAEGSSIPSRPARITADHAFQGVVVQMVLRLALVVFLALTCLLVPPLRDDLACFWIVAAYTVWLAVLGWQVRPRGPWHDRRVWPATFVDLVALSALALITGIDSGSATWTSDVLLRGFFLVPVIAALEQRWRICLVVCAPAVATYLAIALITREANEEPIASVLLRGAVLAGLSAGCVLLARVQASRVAAISELAATRDELLSQLMFIERRERTDLAESLHDGALQYVLGARLDLDELEASTPAETEEQTRQPLARIDHALSRTVALLRSTVAELHPQVLESSGLPRAIAELVRASAARGRFHADLDLDGWDGQARTSADALLFGTVRELLANVVKHASATRVRVAIGLSDGVATLTVADDGVGIPPGRVDAQLAAGHIGIASQRVRLAAAGGGLELQDRDGGGTIARAWMPATRSGPDPGGAHTPPGAATS
ncbi:putative sensor histidine kinase NarS [Microbacterium sp. 8M]|uniref:sensor histidine kinase n=1 Tax=Microbacterium sp. 8M TaxID=2653153 RepID=UPI0012F1B2AC|nr:ATP-binding protein [Microbacterium sp. 8M]VXC27610.1 putative sensor histidine kinase NarS [Microbacterium sp. 8M]